MNHNESSNQLLEDCTILSKEKIISESQSSYNGALLSVLIISSIFVGGSFYSKSYQGGKISEIVEKIVDSATLINNS